MGDTLVGTSGNDTFKAVATTNGSTAGTLNAADSIDGGAGTDTLVLVAGETGAAIPASASIKNIEVIQFDVTGATFAAGVLDAKNFAGVKELTQIDNVGTSGAFASVVAADGVAVGFSSNNSLTAAVVGTDATIDFGATATSGVVKLSGVGTSSNVVLADQTTTANVKLATLTVEGSVAASSATTAGTLNIDLGATSANNKVDTLKLGLTSKTIVAVSTADAVALKTLDGSGSTGGLESSITAGTGGLVKLETIKTGSAGDKLTLTLATDSLLTKVDLGAGADTLLLKDSIATSATSPLNNKALEINLGAGADTLTLATGDAALNNVQDTADLTKGLITVADFKIGEDTINLGGVGKALTKTGLDNAAAASTLQAAIAVVAADIGTAKTAVFKYGTDAYVFINDTAAGLNAGDGLIKLVGVDATLLSTDQNGGLVL